MSGALGLSAKDHTAAATRKIKKVMEKLRWEYKRKRINGNLDYAWVNPTPDESASDNSYN
jgi:hypothetical protein